MSLLSDKLLKGLEYSSPITRAAGKVVRSPTFQKYFAPKTGVVATAGRNALVKLDQSPVVQNLSRNYAKPFLQSQNPITAIPRQFSRGYISGANAGLVQGPGPQSQGLAQGTAEMAGNIAGAFNPYSMAGRFYRGVNATTNPALAKLTGSASKYINPRVAGATANVIQGIGIDKTLGQPTTPTSLGIDVVTGLAMGPNQFDVPQTPRKSNFTMDKLTYDELMEAEGMINNPKSYIGKYITGADTEKEAIKAIRERGLETLERLSAKYLPNRKLTLKTPQAKIKALADLNSQNRLGNANNVDFTTEKQLDLRKFPMSGLVDGNQNLRKPPLGSYTNVRQIDNKLAPGTIQPNLGDDAVDIGVGAVKKKGFTPEEITKQQADETIVGAILQEEEIPRVKQMFNRVFNPLKNAPKEIQDSTKKWRSNLLMNRQKANQMAAQFKNVNPDDGWKMVRYMENPTPQKAAELGFNPQQYGKEMAALRKIYDNMRQKGVNEGLEVGYLDNYLNHVWQESFDDIVKARGLGKRPAFTKERVIPTYEEGLKMGLTPAFTHPGQLAAHYRYQLNKALANKKLADDLVNSGYLLPASKAPIDWRPIEAPLFPKSVHNIGNKTLVEPYAAPPNVSEAMKGIFGQEKPGFTSLAAGVSKVMQDITLSGGIPKTPVNAFTLANAVKEVTAGKVVSPVKAFFRSFSDNASRNYFKQNSKYMKMMGEEGIPTYSNFDYQNAYKNVAENRALKQVLGEKWDNLMSKPTFERFLPQLQVQTFKEVFESAKKSGKSADEARKVAGDVTKNFYGIADNFSRPRFTEDVMSALFFAPRFRESMLNFWFNNLKALNPKASNYKLNRRFIVGTAISYVLYDQLNRKLNDGRPMNENKPGKELFLEIPREEGRSWFIPLLPSIGTVPRRIAEAGSLYASGNVREGSQKAASMLSQPVSLAGQLATNRTFYGGPIAGKDDNVLSKYAGYTFEQTAHPFLGEPVAAMQGRKTSTEAGLSMLELPVYPSKSTSKTNISKQAGTGFNLFGGLNQAKAADESKQLPTNKRDLSVLYDDANRIIDNYAKNKVKSQYGLVDKPLEEYQAEVDQAIAMKKQIEKERPELVLDMEFDNHTSGGSKTVEERAKWAHSTLKTAKSESELGKLIDRMYKDKVLTKSVVEMLNEQYGLNLTKYIEGGKIKSLSKSGGSSKKTISDAQLLSAYKKALSAANASTNYKISNFTNQLNQIATPRLKRQVIRSLT